MKTTWLKSSFLKASMALSLGLVMPGAQVWAQEHVMDTSKTKVAHVLVSPGELTWADGPPGLPAGAKVAVLSGDPFKAGLFTIRLKFPANYTVQAHWHPADEHVTVLSGTLFVGMGDKFDSKKLKTLSTGAYTLMPQKNNHFAMVKEETIIQLHAMGPFAITYVNPADDPRSKSN